eukprot:1140982-Pelagomonas_calceolata.AAC.2
MTPTQQDSSAEGPPSKHTRFTMKLTYKVNDSVSDVLRRSQPHSQNNPVASASQSTANYIPIHPNYPCTTNPFQAGNILSPPTCPNAPHSQIHKTATTKIRGKIASQSDRDHPSFHQPPQLNMTKL